MKLLDLFAGVGVAVGARSAGWYDFGVENDPDALKTRELNEIVTVGEDVWRNYLIPPIGYDAIWASPPCQTYSTANSKALARKELEVALEVLSERGDGLDIGTLWEAAHGQFEDPRSALALAPLTYAQEHDPESVILEQVPAVLPLWEAFKEPLEMQGYETWIGILDAYDMGLPQRRRRAYLIANKDRHIIPELSDTRMTMFDALGWGITDAPSPTVTSKTGVTRAATGTQSVYQNAIDRGAFVFNPSGSDKPSKVAKNGIGSKYPPGKINTTVDDNKVLQGFPRDMEFAGNLQSQQLQVGNAVPPPVAESILRQIKEGVA